MLKRIIILTIGLNIAFICHSVGQSSTTATSYRFIEEVSFTISGTSNVRDWNATTDKMQGRVVAGPEFIAWSSDSSLPETGSDAGSGWFREVVFSIVSKDLDSGINAMNNTMYDNLKAEQHRRIRYQLTDVKEARNIEGSNDLVLLVNGIARAAGVDHPVEHEVTVSRINANLLTISGELQMNISDFNIDPPTFMRGALVTEDKINVSYRFNIRASE